jgi:hypothetical protein
MNFTILDCERCVAEAIKPWVQDFMLKSPADRGAVPIPIEVVQGFIPSYQAGPQLNGQNKAPVIAVRISHGFYHRLKGDVAIDMIVLTWDDDLNRQGYRDAMNICQAIVTGLYETGVIARSFPLLDTPVTWDLIEDPSKDFFPYFVAGIQAHFGLMTPGINEADYSVGEQYILRSNGSSPSPTRIYQADERNSDLHRAEE